MPQLISEALTIDLSVKDVTPITASLPPENVLPPSSFSYSFYSFQSNAAACALTLPDLVVAFSNAVWYHSSLGHLSLIPGYVFGHSLPLPSIMLLNLLNPFSS